MSKSQWYITLAILVGIAFWFSWLYGVLVLLFLAIAYKSGDPRWWRDQDNDRP